MSRERSALRWLERSLFAAAALGLGAWTAVNLGGRLLRIRDQRRLDELIRARAAVSTASARAARPARLEVGDVLGRIEAPRAGVSAVIVEGDDDLTLSFAAGHIPGTALPGQNGNVALAGHRDGVFHGLERVRPDDVLVVTTPRGTYRYVVDATSVVEPTDVGVLRPVGGPTLTLVTCYPFRYIGPAPERFVVSARLVGRAPAPADSG